MKISGSEAIIKCLLEENVDLIYGYPGGAIMPFYDSLYNYQDKINHVLVRHEQGATHAAQGYSRSSGKVGVVIATSGPGATNLVTGIADAQIDSTPMVCITGQVSSNLLGSDAFQETDIIGITTPITKWNYQITKASEISTIFSKAFYIARSGRPGPVLIDITKDAQFEMTEFLYKKHKKLRSYNPKPEISDNSISDACRLINKAKKPFIIFGQGVILANAEEEFRVLMEKTGIPSAWTILGLSAVATDHPLNVGMVGMHGNYGPNVLTNECDLLIAVGMRFDDRVTGNLNHYAINIATNGNAIIVTDVGQHQMVACRYAKFNESKSNITSGGLGTMGFALPAAIGAKMGAPKREVIAVIGDGGFQMTIQELGTIFQTGVPVKIVVLNNDFLGMVRQWQQLFFDKRYSSTEMVNPDFVAIANGYQIESERISKRENLKKSIQKMIDSPNPFFMEVVVGKEDNVFPMIPTGESVSNMRLS